MVNGLSKLNSVFYLFLHERLAWHLELQSCFCLKHLQRLNWQRFMPLPLHLENPCPSDTDSPDTASRKLTNLSWLMSSIWSIFVDTNRTSCDYICPSGFQILPRSCRRLKAHLYLQQHRECCEDHPTSVNHRNRNGYIITNISWLKLNLTSFYHTFSLRILPLSCRGSYNS